MTTTRAQRLLRNTLILTAIYILLLTETITLPLIPKPIITLAPWWLLITVGAYCLAVLGLGLLRVTDCSPAYEELVQDIGMAKVDLQRRGISIEH